MSKFDIAKARQEKRVSEIVDHLLPAALGEIERLTRLVDETVVQLGACRLVAKQIQNGQAKRIAELEAALQVEKSAHGGTKYAAAETSNQAFSRIAKQRAALKKLGEKVRQRGKALVEERARCIACDASGDFVDVRGEYMFRIVSPNINVARDQLRQEGLL
ncbi:hypothetical protein M0R72_07135 [Candidatus Pacearchaeota archaeon]|jgi:hypothetical protein|nr:hypothetical protein [Candidatus Pacearchaeota archaeon]